jgi:hypothetical protein
MVDFVFRGFTFSQIFTVLRELNLMLVEDDWVINTHESGSRVTNYEHFGMWSILISDPVAYQNFQAFSPEYFAPH